MYEFLRTKEEKLGPISGTTAALWYPADFLSGCWCFSWFPWPVCPPPGFLCFFVDVVPNPRILCIRIWEFSTASACVLFHVFFFSILSSYTTCQRASFNSTTDSFLRGHDPYTLACKARPSFDRCGTPLSVSLSLSLSLKQSGSLILVLRSCRC